LAALRQAHLRDGIVRSGRRNCGNSKANPELHLPETGIFATIAAKHFKKSFK
jgi:hypothetical protein